MNKKHLQELEPRIGISFVRPDNHKFKILQDDLGVVAEFLGTRPPDLRVPPRGFLSRPLIESQKKHIDQMLGPAVAREGVALQDRLDIVPIRENGERMISIPKLFERAGIPLSLSQAPFNSACGKWAGKQRVYWVRENVAQRLLLAGQSLKKIGLVMHLEDAFRPFEVQEGLFLRRIQLILQEHSDWVDDWDRVWTEARSKTAVAPWMAGHTSGAAVDITLQTLQGKPLPLGNSYPDGGPRVALHFPYLTQEEWSTRMLFAHTMELSGLRIYPYENWHASFGDLSASITFGENVDITPDYTTQYGPIKGFNQSSGEIEAYNESEYLTPFYKKEDLLWEVLSKH